VTTSEPVAGTPVVGNDAADGVGPARRRAAASRCRRGGRRLLFRSPSAGVGDHLGNTCRLATCGTWLGDAAAYQAADEPVAARRVRAEQAAAE
jgi:hypothetical protein